MARSRTVHGSSSWYSQPGDEGRRWAFTILLDTTFYQKSTLLKSMTSNASLTRTPSAVRRLESPDRQPTLSFTCNDTYTEMTTSSCSHELRGYHDILSSYPETFESCARLSRLPRTDVFVCRSSRMYRTESVSGGLRLPSSFLPSFLTRRCQVSSLPIIREVNNSHGASIRTTPFLKPAGLCSYRTSKWNGRFPSSCPGSISPERRRRRDV